MSDRRTLRVRASLAVALLAIAISCLPALSSAKQAEPGKTATDAVPPVEATPPSLPSLPEQAPRPAPPATPTPTEVPPPPRTPPVEPVPSVEPEVPSTSQRPSAPAPVRGAARDADRAPRPSPAASPQAVERAGGSSAAGAARNTGAARGGSGGDAQGTAASTLDVAGQPQSGPRGPDSEAPAASVDPARAAPLARWLAYVWPAFALERPVGVVLSALQSELPAAARLPTPDLLRVLAPVPVATRIAEAGGLGASVQTSAPPAQQRAGDSTLITLPSGAEISALGLVASCLALAGLLAYAVRRELSSMRHRPF